MIPSTVAVSTMGARSAPARRTAAIAIATTKDARLRIMVSPFVDTLVQGLRVAGRGIERQSLLDLGLRRCHVLQPQVRVGERHMRRGGIAAPDRNLQRVDGFARTPGTEVDSADQQVRLRFVGREEDGPSELHHRLAILLPLEEPAAPLQVKLREVTLVPLPDVRDRLGEAAAALRLALHR